MNNYFAYTASNYVCIIDDAGILNENDIWSVCKPFLIKGIFSLYINMYASQKMELFFPNEQSSSDFYKVQKTLAEQNTAFTYKVSVQYVCWHFHRQATEAWDEVIYSRIFHVLLLYHPLYIGDRAGKLRIHKLRYIRRTFSSEIRQKHRFIGSLRVLFMRTPASSASDWSRGTRNGALIGCRLTWPISRTPCKPFYPNFMPSRPYSRRLELSEAFKSSRE